MNQKNDVVEKIVRVSKDIRLDAQGGFRPNSKTLVPYEAYIATSKDHPNMYFLVHKNLIMNAGTIDDTSYEVHKFDAKGKHIGEVSNEKLTRSFYRELDKIHDIK